MVNKIRNLFSSLGDNKLNNLNLSSEKYNGYVYKNSDEYGVCFEISESINIQEKFNMVLLKTHVLQIKNKKINMLMMGCKNMNYKNEFAVICSDFLKLGENNEYREAILKNPYLWFEKWKNLVGNRKANLTVYDILGELFTLLYLYEKGEKPIWNSMNMGTHDIEAGSKSYEVKSTIKKMSKEIIINSPHQLEHDNGKELFLSYCQFEKSELGNSIEDLKPKLIGCGMIPEELDSYLQENGYMPGKSEYKEKYLIREMLLYKVDEQFPKLTFENFIDGKLPKGILYYSYTVDLSGIESIKIK